MMKRTRILIAIAALIALPFMMAAVNIMMSWYYDLSYPQLSAGVVSKNYQLSKIRMPGIVVDHDANSNVIDSMYVSIDSAAPPTYIKYTGQVFLDTLSYNFKVESMVDTSSHEGYDRDGSFYINTINAYGKILSSVIVPKGSSGKYLKSCILLKDIMLPFQPWLDHDQPVYLNFFSKKSFNSRCFDPFRGFGSPNGSGTCSFWQGEGYYNIVLGDEKLKFKLPTESGALLFSTSFDFPTYVMNFAVVPERFRKHVNASFLVYQHHLYMARKKQP